MYDGIVEFYDKFMSDVDYSAWCDFALQFIGGKKGFDIGCGSGKFTIELAKRGYDVVGGDPSPLMIEKAYVNARKEGVNIPFVVLDAEKFNLASKVDFVTAVCDVVNYLKTPKIFFKKAFDCLCDDGVLFFDVSSEYKLKKILGNNTFSDETEDSLYVWNNYLSKNYVDLELSFFRKDKDGRYTRYDENQRQFIHKSEDLVKELKEIGFSQVCVYSDLSKNNEERTSERLYFIAKKGKLMTNIIKMQNNADYWFNKGVEYSDLKEYLKAIDCFSRALEMSENDVEVLLEMAGCYTMLKEYDTAVSFYHKILTIDEKCEIAFIGLISVYIEQQKDLEAVYYIKHCAEKDIISEDYEINITTKEYDRFKILDRYDKTATITLARRLLTNGEYDYAHTLLKDVPKQSPQYLEALNLIAMIYLGQEKYVNSAMVCDEVLSLNTTDVYALTTKVVSMYYLGNKLEIDKALKVIDGLNFTEQSEIKKIAVCMQQIKDDARALVHFKKLLEFMPTDRNSNLAVAILEHNLGNKEASHLIMVKLAKLYPFDEVVRFYAKELYYNDARLDVIFDLPQDEQMRRINIIEDVLTKKSTIHRVTEHAKKNKDFYNLIKWLMSSDQIIISAHVGDFLAQHPFWHPLLREILASPTVNYYPKRECLGTFLQYAQRKSFVLFVQDYLQFCRPKKPPAVVHESLEIAYYKVYAALVFILPEIGKEFTKKFKDFCDLVNEKKLLEITDDATIFSALFAYSSKMHPIFENVNLLCELFKTDKELLKDYIKEIFK